MGSFWWERVIHKKHHGINEIFGNIKHYLKLKKKKIWGSQLRLKAQPPCWFFAPRLTWPVFFSTYSFFFFFLNNYKVHPWIWNEHWWDESSSYRVVPAPAGSVQSQGLTARESTHIHQHIASQRQRTREPVVKPDSQESSTHSVLPTESTQLKRLLDTCRGVWAWRSPGLWDLKQPIPCIFPVLVPPQLRACANTLVCMVTW